MKENKLTKIALGAAILGIAISEPALSQEWKNSYSINTQYVGAVCVYLAPSQGNLDVQLEWANFLAYDKLNLMPGVVYALSVPVKSRIGWNERQLISSQTELVVS